MESVCSSLRESRRRRKRKRRRISFFKRTNEPKEKGKGERKKQLVHENRKSNNRHTSFLNSTRRLYSSQTGFLSVWGRESNHFDCTSSFKRSGQNSRSSRGWSAIVSFRWQREIVTRQPSHRPLLANLESRLLGLNNSFFCLDMEKLLC